MSRRSNRYLRTRQVYLSQSAKNLHMNLQANLHPSDPWNRYCVIWAKNEVKGFDLLVFATNNPDTPARSASHE